MSERTVHDVMEDLADACRGERGSSDFRVPVSDMRLVIAWYVEVTGRDPR